MQLRVLYHATDHTRLSGTPVISNITATTASVTWAVPSGATSYQSSLNAGSSWTSTGASNSVNLTGLTPVTAYSFEVEAVNAGGTSLPNSASFTTLPVIYTDTPTLTVGNYVFFTGYGIAVTGANPNPAYGSLVPATTTTGKSYTNLENTINFATGTNGATLSVSGFAASPGIGWLTSITTNGVTKTGASALYSYSAGVANWQWLTVPFSLPALHASGTVTIVHQ
jgi:mannan endo-1,4-beta-mannosidase